MVTFVEKQDHFGEALKGLLELEYTAVEAYKTAITRLDRTDYKETLKEFLTNHQRHIKEFTTMLENKNEEAPYGSGLGNEPFNMGQVILSNMVGDNSILSTMRSHEVDTIIAYEQLNNRDDAWPEVREFLQHDLVEERVQKAWFDMMLNG